MKILIGLGNPGKKYENTRHNAGFLFLDFFAKKNDFENFSDDKKFFGEISVGNIGGEKIILLKPDTFMNLSGKSIQAILNFYKIDFEDFFVIYDDKDLDFGKIRFRDKGSSGGHNGIKDIAKILGHGDFKRIKIGIKDDEKLKLFGTSDFVLGNFSDEEKIFLDEKIFSEVEKIFFENI